MKRYFCCCGSEIFFENTVCNSCSRDIGFDPDKMRLFTLDHDEATGLREYCRTIERVYKYCDNREMLSCNWLIDADSPQIYCASCRLTRTIPMISIDKNRIRWNTLESRKRRLLYNILNHGLTYDECGTVPEGALCFDFLEDQRSNPYVDLEFAYTGHKDGVITMNIAEADPDFRASMQISMNEQYRTILGHFRHEIGHYYYDRLIKNSGWTEQFTELFGDPDQDYQHSLEKYYEQGPKNGWLTSHITAYASMHPLEDWAETWAHYLHMRDGLETALSFEIINLNVDYSNFDDLISKWMEFTVVLNALNRSIGRVDAYPFVINPFVAGKLRMIHEVIHRATTRSHV
ncbi:zinc-binding metallopeptidase family protein [Limisalsivibrio acetivorans]|uniref:zinc-binding metallopeptidase family protein n=1 Tax=Limisalsivibrio acetivorans TaxID=1304888 RepID=UPI0003B64261|nr:putative zinc-binding metallopeptidase [Limisalsivibrio acetivorans]